MELECRSIAALLSGAEAQRAFENARAAANSALRLAPDLAAAHLALGRLILWADFNWAGIEAEYRRALQLAPNDGSAKAALADLAASLEAPHNENKCEPKFPWPGAHRRDDRDRGVYGAGRGTGIFDEG